jgi:hypothetical protein
MKSLVNAIVQSIKAAKFDDKLASTLENLADSSDGLEAIDLLNSKKIQVENEHQLSVYLSYLQCIASAFGPQEIQPWYGLILSSLEHTELDLLKVLSSLMQTIMSKDSGNAFRQKLLAYYFEHKPQTSITEKVLLDFAETHAQVSD